MSRKVTFFEMPKKPFLKRRGLKKLGGFQRMSSMSKYQAKEMHHNLKQINNQLDELGSSIGSISDLT